MTEPYLYSGDALIRIRNTEGVSKAQLIPGRTHSIAVELNNGDMYHITAMRSGMFAEVIINQFIELYCGK